MYVYTFLDSAENTSYLSFFIFNYSLSDVFIMLSSSACTHVWCYHSACMYACMSILPRIFRVTPRREYRGSTLYIMQIEEWIDCTTFAFIQSYTCLFFYLHGNICFAKAYSSQRGWARTGDDMRPAMYMLSLAVIVPHIFIASCLYLCCTVASNVWYTCWTAMITLPVYILHCHWACIACCTLCLL